MPEKRRPPLESKKKLTLTTAHDQLLDFFDHNPEIAAFFPEIVQTIKDSPIRTASSVQNTLSRRHVGALIPRSTRIEDNGTLPIAVHPQDIPDTGKNRT